IPAGEYKISSTLKVGSGGNYNYLGFMLFGDGDGNTSGGGTRIIYSGSDLSAILTINKDAWRRAYFSDFSLVSSVRSAAIYGIKVDGTQVSAHRFERISIWFVKTAIGILAGTGRN